QRAQVETAMSMLKRNLGDALRCRSDSARQRELVLRSIVHNIMIIGARMKGRDRAERTQFGGGSECRNEANSGAGIAAETAAPHQMGRRNEANLGAANHVRDGRATSYGGRNEAN